MANELAAFSKELAAVVEGGGLGGLVHATAALFLERRFLAPRHSGHRRAHGAAGRRNPSLCPDGRNARLHRLAG